MAYMDSNALGERARRLIPTYQDLLSDYLGMAQIVVAFLVAIVAIIGLFIMIYPGAGASGILLAVSLFTCGTFGVLAGVKKEIWAVCTYLALSIISLLLCLVLIGCAVTGLSVEYKANRSVSVEVREGIDIALVALSLLSATSAIISIVITSSHLITDSCNCFQGVKYVQEPTVQFTNPVNADTAQTTIENSDYDQSSGGDVTLRVEGIPPPQSNETGNGQQFNNPLAVKTIS